MLVAAAVGLLALATLLVGALLWQSHQRYHEAAADSAQNAARSLEHFLNAHFQESELALQSAVMEYQRLHSTGEFSRARFSTYLESLKQRLPNALSIRGADAKGRIVYGAGVDPARPVSIAEEAHFMRMREDMRLHFGPPLRSRVTGEWLFSIMLPLIDRDGAFAGAVYVNTENQRIEDTFSTVQLGTDGLIVLFDEDRNIIVRHPALPRVSHTALRVTGPPTLAALDAGQSSAVYRAISPYDARARMIAYRKIGHYPTYVLVGLAEESYLAPWWRECWMGVFFLVVIATGSLLLGLSLRRYMSASLRVEMLEERQASHDHLAAIIRAIPDLLFEVDIEGRYLDYSTTNPELLAIPPDDYIGRKVTELLPGAAASTVMAAIAEANEKAPPMARKSISRCPRASFGTSCRSLASRITAPTSPLSSCFRATLPSAVRRSSASNNWRSRTC